MTNADDPPVVVLEAERIAREPMLAETIRRGNAQALARLGGALIQAGAHLGHGGRFDDEIRATLRKSLDAARWIVDHG